MSDATSSVTATTEVTQTDDTTKIAKTIKTQRTAWDDWGSRKLWLTVGVMVSSYIALLLNRLDGGQWVMLALAALGLHNASNIADKHFNGP